MLSRRALLLSAAAASTLVPTLARSQAAPSAGPGGGSEPQTVLRLLRRTIEVKGKPASVYGIQQPDGTFGLRTGVGNRFRVRVENRIEEPSLIHWHGLTPPWQQDGVPGVSGPAIPAGGSADYDFPLRFGGTFWMHSHQGLAGATADVGAPDHPRPARPAGPAGSHPDAGGLQLHTAGADIRGAQKGRQDVVR